MMDVTYAQTSNRPVFSTLQVVLTVWNLVRSPDRGPASSSARGRKGNVTRRNGFVGEFLWSYESVEDRELQWQAEQIWKRTKDLNELCIRKNLGIKSIKSNSIQLWRLSRGPASPVMIEWPMAFCPISTSQSASSSFLLLHYWA
ncbi:hypothetical protein MPTK1_4g19250 [Marchantia polymorpha subsp. ruderalis]|uniref:Uncharacterized protein n=2 Tax=Marchantia polymorpha TaxID=3197 RepID=A0AAF6BBI7_MARPO|nr:hypothetical protein MARPO_0169s0019 [Marchantia polymorpha]BBN09371.1 hypothetical protein Mp_4g19250 [Marchantia polymorpha subsp. ruderalis]|eukprot:PTQ28258.1 hypothetical protein MARPO_0169s0019 [Marchantia polymorpha]